MQSNKTDSKNDAVQLKEYPGLLVYLDGRVFLSQSNRLARPSLNSNGYLRLQARKADGRQCCVYVHKLVALAFVPAVPGKNCIDHINGNRTDNRSCNLRWCTAAENVKFPLAVEASRRWQESEEGRQSVISRGLKHRKPVLCITTGVAYSGLKQAAEALGVIDSDICRAIKAKTTASGFSFKYMTSVEYEQWESKETMDAHSRRPGDVRGKAHPVQCVSDGGVFVSAKAAAEHYRTSLNNIARCARGERKTALGLRFRYITWPEYNQLVDKKD